MTKKTINFYLNHNFKLDNNYFTTIRPMFEGYYNKGETYGIILKRVFQFEAEIVDIRKLHVPAINDWIAFLDYGFNAKTLQEDLKRMYPKKDLSKEPLYLILLKRLHVRTNKV